jgi:hypothetical protein
MRILKNRGAIEVDRFDTLAIKLKQAERKVRMLRGIIEALRAAKQEQIKLGEARLATGAIGEADRDALIERKAKLAALDKILATSEETDQPKIGERYERQK